MSAITIRTAEPEELTLATLHDILRLRVDVFVVEQECPYPEIDGHDLLPGTTHRWIAGDATGGSAGLFTPPTDSPPISPPILSYVRTMATAEATPTRKLGRVVTHPAARGQGLADRIIRKTLEAEPGPMICEAQSHLSDWYGRFGFVITGDEFLEDGIAHVPMSID